MTLGMDQVFKPFLGIRAFNEEVDEPPHIGYSYQIRRPPNDYIAY